MNKAHCPQVLSKPAVKPPSRRPYSALISRIIGRPLEIRATGSRKTSTSAPSRILTAPASGARIDPRLFQIAALGALLIFGVAARAFEITPAEFFVIGATALTTQWAMSAIFAVKFEAKSALITTLSLTLLLRAEALWPLAAAAFIAIASKFLLRMRGKHVFNPANIGIVAVTLATGAAWTTPGQWGTAVWLAALIAGVGSFVTWRASRLDVPLFFLGVFAMLLFARATWLGDPLSIPMLRLQNGALVLFAFFMISDPKTTPDGLLPRIAFAAGTAMLAYVFIFHFYKSDGVFYALAIACLIRPLIELFDSARPYQWRDATISAADRKLILPAE
ncbi:MAG TPA: RnfABCDGE type electron transport complex subunit D [Parvularculaceae bacterium]|nr:RnfABCDGE type electron transport complex subunit D [Parvularculaceae bacterium]